jgi:hypothetical protein
LYPLPDAGSFLDSPRGIGQGGISERSLPDMLSRISESLITLFVVLDPIGSVPIFLNATGRLAGRER